MSVVPELTSRQQQVLRATVNHYIATAEPVGSKALVESYALGVSSATIRNTMGVLERAGLLFQPHTSAGRVPSDSGYRLYVDQLILPAADLMRQMGKQFSQQLPWGEWSVEALLRGAAQILASVSGCITLITLPQSETVRLRYLQVLQVEPQRVLLILVTDDYQSQSALLNLAQIALPPVDRLDRELQILSNFLNQQLQHRPLSDLTSLDWEALGQELNRYADSVQSLLIELSRRLQPPATTQLLISGVSELLRQPEFNQLQQVQALLELLEGNPEQVWPLVFDPRRSKVSLHIGAENPLEPMQSCSLVAAAYRKGDRPIGSVGLIGPTRLDYERAIAAVEATAEYLSRAFGEVVEP
jgi:heat-inducible transcriptional repressor